LNNARKPKKVKFRTRKEVLKGITKRDHSGYFIAIAFMSGEKEIQKEAKMFPALGKGSVKGKPPTEGAIEDVQKGETRVGYSSISQKKKNKKRKEKEGE